ncbi:MAG: cadmium-translocating P-type ATPase [Rhizobiales bacterium]|jgi:heavy metal translocating P-type ATPase|nr:cadmium-translocating P-type ATPase [Hyphomicrobiales bacterium]
MVNEQRSQVKYQRQSLQGQSRRCKFSFKSRSTGIPKIERHAVLSPLKLLLVLISALGLAAGFLAPYFGLNALQATIWGFAAAFVLLFLAREILTSLWRGEFGLDIVAALSMSGALYFGETLAAAVVSLMYSGGQLLENFAEARARSEMNTLLGRVPTKALRYLDGNLSEVRIEELVPGDRILVRQGEIVPVDGKVASGRALLDQSILTGESVPVYRNVGDDVLSGSSSLDMAFDVIAIRPASQSTYAGIVRLVKAAQEAKAPMVRLADRFAMWFLALTVLLAGGTWMITGEHLRMLAVLVSATPCPLILAVPVAIISGISKAARRGVLVKGGPVLETLARASVLVIDKTGTLTEGRARLVDVHSSGRRSADEILRLAASLDQASQHVIAKSIVEAASERGLTLSMPVRAKEMAGSGIEGHVDGKRIIVGGGDFVRGKLKQRTLKKPAAPPGSVVVAVAVGDHLAGYLILADALRGDAADALTHLRKVGFTRIVLASGDQHAVVEDIAAQLELDQIRSELLPGEKVDVVVAERANGVVLMAGDGVNDAPALAAADVGISMGVRGSPASAESADAVLLVDNLGRIAEAVEIAQRSRAIALQSVYVGLALSLGAMVAAAFGYLSVVEGALFQEAIDVAVILNALRALR